MIVGGSIDTNHLFVTLLIVTTLLCILLIYYSYTSYVSKKLSRSIDECTGDTSTASSQYASKYLHKHAITPIQHYTAGIIYERNEADKHKALHHYNEALRGIQENPALPDTRFIIDKLTDVYAEEKFDDVELQRAIAASLEVVEEKYEMPTNDLLEKKIVWHNDKQNVHDSSMIAEIKRQFDIVRDGVSYLPNIHDYEEACNYVLTHSNDKDATSLVLSRINENNYISWLNTGEKEVISTVWKRAFDPRNDSSSICSALVLAVSDCYENNSVVCVVGRVAKIWQSLSCIDFEGMGSLRTKEVLRNEIYTRCSKILQDYITSPLIDETTRSDYNEGRETPATMELVNNVKRDYNAMIHDYPNDVELARNTIDECITVL